MEWEPDPSSSKGEGFTTTHLFLVIIAIIGLAILYNVTRLPKGDPYAKCQRIIGHDTACRADVAYNQMMRGRL
ncbi:hypothetical protein [Sphingopyxis sp. C-1]|uniref:hypothetical protein n=1 Tax=Sphingopyxis sp. C-1 TaxID=262667 RepID=UPI0006BEF9D6|nr:hypothetical protein [Sphingopyxis sp. C-1]GAO79766.1 hypothetical protein SC1_03087 [Sphingopyxis sp. C-1]